MSTERESNGNRNNELFVSLLTGHHSRILAYIRTLVPQHQDAEDVFQKASLTLWQKFDEFDQNSDFFPWAAKISFYTVCNHRRKRYRDRLVFSEQLLELMSQERVTHLESHESRMEYLLECMQQLSPRDQQLLVRAYRDASSIKEMATESGKAVQTLYNRLTTLRRGLVNCVHQKTVMHRAT